MAIIDVRILRSIKISETKLDKQGIALSATQDLLFIGDTKDPPFNDVLTNEDTWPNLGNVKVPQIDDYTVVKGVQMYVTSREVSYYKDNERAVVMTVKYDATPEEPEEPEEPESTDPETWQRITVTSQQMTKPAVGWPSIGAIPPELGNDDEGNGAQNSAGDPVDGLEEDCAMVKLVYTNTQVVTPVFSELQRYTNRCNDAEFLGGAMYTVRMLGWSAEYDQKINVWSVSVEFLYNPDGWQIQYFDAGFNEIIGGDRRAILDKVGNPVSKPVPLNGGGQAQTINASPTGDDKPTEPVMLELYPYKIADMQALFFNCGI